MSEGLRGFFQMKNNACQRHFRQGKDSQISRELNSTTSELDRPNYPLTQEIIYISNIKSTS